MLYSLKLFARTHPFKKIDDRNWLESFKKGEDRAFSEIYDRYQKPVLKYVTKKVRDTEVAQDVTQEIFLKIYRFRESYSEDHSFTSWLWTIARNTVIDWSRKSKVEPRSDLTTMNEAQPIEEALACPKPHVEIVLDHHIEKQKLAKLLSGLTSLQRKVIWMRVVYQLPYQEIAKQLGMSISAVKCLAYRSKQALTKMGYSPAFA